MSTVPRMECRLLSAQGNVLGLMPHPENQAELELGSSDGVALFAGLMAEREVPAPAEPCGER